MDAPELKSSEDGSAPVPSEVSLGKGTPGAFPLHENGHSKAIAEGSATGEGSASKGDAAALHSIVQTQAGTGQASGDREGVGTMVVHSVSGGLAS